MCVLKVHVIPVQCAQFQILLWHLLEDFCQQAV